MTDALRSQLLRRVRLVKRRPPPAPAGTGPSGWRVASASMQAAAGYGCVRSSPRLGTGGVGWKRRWLRWRRDRLSKRQGRKAAELVDRLMISERREDECYICHAWATSTDGSVATPRAVLTSTAYWKRRFSENWQLLRSLRIEGEVSFFERLLELGGRDTRLWFVCRRCVASFIPGQGLVVGVEFRTERLREPPLLPIEFATYAAEGWKRVYGVRPKSKYSA